jgi:hypothetical protein
MKDNGKFIPDTLVVNLADLRWDVSRAGMKTGLWRNVSSSEF